ncbi:ferredoxin-type protein NapF [Intestinirhabdus alba]|jgi:ferredoxin-type protein NapF|uniref:Ferredoxin-type protein NapF n=1 Tax=Intestinirhabdus alba TaxID=2899544 RepID=A0A6L6IKC4_9ENTR|nr:ferredoxin-type protein NapF [Intestinirhabdus alba]MTH46595.1 ferredoxin-type protein NapF [Intestinirhabdus alba]
MSDSEKYYQALMTHRHVSRRGLFRAFVTAAQQSAPEARAAIPVHPLPPGALPDAQFRARCTRCDSCISACPMGIVNRHEDGFPELRIEYASCDGCGLCISSCPAGALQPLPRFDTGLRPAFGNGCVNPVRACRQCVDVCPQQACVIGEAGVPQIDDARCNGCGECLVQCHAGAVKLAAIAATGA